MKKQKGVTLIALVFIIIFMLIVVGGCAFAYLYFTNKENTDIMPEQKPEEPVSTEPIFTKNTLPKIDGSTATIPLGEAFASNFTGEEQKVEFSQTHQAYVNLIDGNVDLILVTYPSEDELNLAKQAGVELEIIPVVKEGFVFYVNAKNPINNLSLAQVQDIYSGEITNWKEVGRRRCTNKSITKTRKLRKPNRNYRIGNERQRINDTSKRKYCYFYV